MRVGTAAVFRSGDVAIRVKAMESLPTDSIGLARLLDAKGIPTAQPIADAVVIDGCSITAWHWLKPLDGPVDGEALGRIVRLLHSVDLAELGTVTRVRPWAELGILDLKEGLLLVADEGVMSAAEYDVLSAAFEQSQGWSTRTASLPVACHGDLHPNNVVMTVDGPHLIDLDTLCRAPACWDHAMLTTLDLRGGPEGFTGRSPEATAKTCPMIQGAAIWRCCVCSVRPSDLPRKHDQAAARDMNCHGACATGCASPLHHTGPSSNG